MYVCVSVCACVCVYVMDYLMSNRLKSIKPVCGLSNTYLSDNCIGIINSSIWLHRVKTCIGFMHTLHISVERFIYKSMANLCFFPPMYIYTYMHRVTTP